MYITNPLSKNHFPLNYAATFKVSIIFIAALAGAYRLFRQLNQSVEVTAQNCFKDAINETLTPLFILQKISLQNQELNNDVPVSTESINQVSNSASKVSLYECNNCNFCYGNFYFIMNDRDFVDELKRRLNKLNSIHYFGLGSGGMLRDFELLAKYLEGSRVPLHISLLDKIYHDENQKLLGAELERRLKKELKHDDITVKLYYEPSELIKACESNKIDVMSSITVPDMTIYSPKTKTDEILWYPFIKFFKKDASFFFSDSEKLHNWRPHINSGLCPVLHQNLTSKADSLTKRVMKALIAGNSSPFSEIVKESADEIFVQIAIYHWARSILNMRARKTVKEYVEILGFDEKTTEKALEGLVKDGRLVKESDTYKCNLRRTFHKPK